MSIATAETSHEGPNQCPSLATKPMGCPYARGENIPGPTAYPLIGSIAYLDLKAPFESMLAIQKQYGPVFQMVFAGKREISVCTRELANEVCDESRWHKLVSSGVSTLRQVVQDALFTAHHGSRQWGISHRILKPIFGPLSVRSMFDEMSDVAEQLCLKWARHGPDQAIDVAADYTRLTLDTIALCMMDYRFNSFYRDGQHHPFVSHMVSILSEADIQAMLPDWAGFFRPRAMRKFKKDIQLMTELCRGMVEHRRRNPVSRRDFLNAMLNNSDPETGERLDDDEIVRNLITFLVAGHETTSGMLSFATYYLLAHPETLAKAQKEIDDVIGAEAVSAAHLGRLPYLDAVFREALRLMPTAVAFYVTPYETEMLGGKYVVEPGEAVCLLLDPIHRDRAVYGDDADEWRPERMLQQEFEALPPNAWKPFGNGQRICLGMAFTWQEAKLAMAMLLKNFDLEMHDPAYKLKIKHLLTIKPEGFEIRAKLRRGRTATDLHNELRRGQPQGQEPVRSQDMPLGQGEELAILYGSDTGSCEALANRLASNLDSRGFRTTVGAMNSAVGHMPQFCVFICGTYHGKPAANASEFVRWVEELQPGSLNREHKYAVLGCGHSDWASTFYMIPLLLDAKLEVAGAVRLLPMGKVNNARDDAFEVLDRWTGEILGAARDGEPGTDPVGSSPSWSSPACFDVTVVESPDVELTNPSPPPGFCTATVSDSKILATDPDTGRREKGHLELILPADMTYAPGWHVQVLPRNDEATIDRALRRFGLRSDSIIVVNAKNGAISGGADFPLGMPIRASHLFAGRDLRRAITRSEVLSRLSELAVDDTARAALATNKAAEDLDENPRSLLNVLDQFPPSAVPITLAELVALLPRMQVRTYSFSSCPASMAATAGTAARVGQRATLTFSIIDQQANPTRGVGSNFLSTLAPQDVVHVSIRPGQDSSSKFRLPSDPSTPVIMIGAGAGIAPFRAFVQQRAEFLRNGTVLGRALLFFGCKGPHDDLYRDELSGYSADIVTVERAYSRPLGGGAGRYVDDALLGSRRDEVVELWRRGAVVLVCGSKGLADGVVRTLVPVLFGADKLESRIGTHVVGQEDWWEDCVAGGRYVAEVFA
ncbi:cytochrome P450 [Colletotrichum graminicola]|uniref:Bifunctional cytochrome P450/NADPH--P450 reductase n=1 Tax=Colletotrichum graminicola (strain M1.001 / M2 / FGSC 10212) TaxID=645133 RepID=E3QZJ3_COLGM|nr:cytochrome P450 [Colletotrichum graminicola M1.001]EFQ36281.1 cytochrome P450 [Colletotrichum graminicola M1.001]WDK19602.1 cytochrome P450 [Colletotrichum graminicola]